MNNISIIIPILNESDTIRNLMSHLLKNSSQELISEIIIVDGGSTDGSQEIVQQFVSSSAAERSQKGVEFLKPLIIFLNSEKGRAKQMNTGAKTAQANTLYFLHADSFPPKNFDRLIINKIEKGHKAGCFKMKFNSSHWWLKLAGWFTQLPWRICRGGDQSLFITKSLFNEIGGFDENFTICEDTDFIAKLYKYKQFVVIKKWLTTSARRYETAGVWRLQYHFWVIHLKKRFGVSEKDLHHYYLKHVFVKK
jgi:rSAM/selenodomain-associated transferase 2